MLPPPLRLSSVATPNRTVGQPPQVKATDPAHQAALVAAEDKRLRTLLHHTARMTMPVVLPVRGGLPTLVLPSRAQPYGFSDLLSAGAALPLRGSTTGYLLADSVLVVAGATLQISSADVGTLLMDSSATGFTSLVTWGGTLRLTGHDAQHPLTVTGWDSLANAPAQDRGYGRPYIRAVGGDLQLSYVRAAALGFWSGRTGGVAWTGVSSKSSTGSATSSTFTGNMYGAFVSRGNAVDFSDDLFQGNELDGLRLHRSAIGSTVTQSAAADNGGNGFVVSRGATGNVLTADLSLHNQGNGFLLDGRPLVSGASPSGDSSDASSGTKLTGGDAENNGRTGILVEGGNATVLIDNTVCSQVTGVALRAGANGTIIGGNNIRCGGRVALSIGPAVVGSTVSGNTISQTRIGILARNSPGIRLIDNRISGVSLFGLSVRGSSPGVVGDGNSIAGRGFRPIDTQGGAQQPLMTDTDLSQWHRRSKVGVLGYLRYHPILTVWLGIIGLVIVASLVVRRHRRPAGPYRFTAPWQPTDRAALPVPGLASNGNAKHALPDPTRDATPIDLRDAATGGNGHSAGPLWVPGRRTAPSAPRMQDGIGVR